MTAKKKLKVIKVPLGYRQEYKAINFPPMPQLYLDLLENKEKIKEELKDKLYEPKWDSYENTHLIISNDEVNSSSNDFRESLKEFDSTGEELSNLRFSQNFTRSSLASNRYEKGQVDDGIDFVNDDPYASKRSDDFTKNIMRENFNKPYSEASKDENSPHRFDSTYIPENIPRSRSSRHSNIGDFKSRSERYSNIEKYDRDERRSKDHDSRKESRSNYDTLRDNERRGESRRDDRYESRRDERYESRRDYDRYDRRDESRRDDRYESRRDYDRYDRREERREEPEDEIGMLLSKDLPEDPKPSQSVYSSNNFNNKKPVSSSGSSSIPQFSHPPQRPIGLDAINQNTAGKSRVYNMSQVNAKSDEEQEQRRRWLMFQFQKLRKLYKEATIPEFSSVTPIETLERTYSELTNQLHIESNVENYKRYLTMGFGVVEFAVIKFLKFEEISGFAAQQMIQMNQYEKILYEIGEKHVPDPDKKGFPPEVKLLLIVLFNAAVFVGMKMLMKGGGNAVFDSTIAPNLGGDAPPRSAAQPVNMGTSAPPQKKKAMKAPDINLDDFN